MTIQNKRFRNLEERMQQAFLRELTNLRGKELKPLMKKLAAQFAGELETLREQANQDVKQNVERVQEWHTSIRRYLNQPEGRLRLPGLLPPFPGMIPERGRWAPDLYIELASCFLESLNSVFQVPFDGFQAEFTPDSGGNAMAEDAGLLAGAIYRSSFQYATSASEGETVQGKLTVRHAIEFPANNFTNAGQLFRRDKLIVEPLAHVILQGSTVGTNTLDLVEMDGGGGQPNPPAIHLTCSFKTKIEQILSANEMRLLDDAETVVHNELIPLNAFGLEMPFGFNTELNGIVLRGDLRPNTAWRLSVDFVIETVAVGGTVSLVFDNLFSQLQVLPPVLSKENCTTRRVNMWDLRALEEAMRPVVG
jgi:hypothetical protein